VQKDESPILAKQHDGGSVDQDCRGSTSIEEFEMKELDDSASAVCTIPHSCLIGAPRKGQQITVLLCGFFAIFQTFGMTVF
jgi:hypothetical protein